MTRVPTLDHATAGDPSTAHPTMSTARAATVATPAGPFTVIASDPDARSDSTELPTVLASGWTADADDLMPLIARDLRPDRVIPENQIAGITDRIAAYHDGDVHAIDDVAVRQHSGPFITHAWDVLRQVAPGEPVTYQQFAARAGRPRAIRAAGSACARNAAALFVPCHRVLPSTGGVGSFRWGSHVKAWLTDHERREDSTVEA